MNFRFNKAKVSTFKTLIRYVLVGLSVFLLLAFINQAIVSNRGLDRGPQQALASSDFDTMNDLLNGLGDVNNGPSETPPLMPVSGGDTECKQNCVTPPAPQPQQPAPQQPAPQPQPQQPAPAPQQPAPAPQGGGRACEPGGWSAVSCSVCNAEGTGMNADGSDWGGYDGQWGSWCGCAQKFSTLQGKAFNSANYPQCGSAPAVPQQPAPQPQPQQPAPQPVAPVVPVTPVTPAPPAGQPLPACISLATNIVCGGQRAYDTCHERTVGGVKFLDCVASQNPNCTGTIQCSTPAPQGPTQTTTQTNQCPSGTTQIVSQNNVITCINNSNQNQNQNSNVAHGGNASAVINIPGGIVSRTEIIREQPVAAQVARVDCPAGTVKKVVNSEVICEVTARSSGVVLAGAKELPKTGIPAIAWAAGALVPMGMKMRKLGKFSSSLISTPSYIWEDREFKK